jgi:hypothetical protein
MNIYLSILLKNIYLYISLKYVKVYKGIIEESELCIKEQGK